MWRTHELIQYHPVGVILLFMMYTYNEAILAEKRMNRNTPLCILLMSRFHHLSGARYHRCRDRGCVDAVWGRLRCPGPFFHSAPDRWWNLMSHLPRQAVSSMLH